MRTRTGPVARFRPGAPPGAPEYLCPRLDVARCTRAARSRAGPVRTRTSPFARIGPGAPLGAPEYLCPRPDVARCTGAARLIAGRARASAGPVARVELGTPLGAPEYRCPRPNWRSARPSERCGRWPRGSRLVLGFAVRRWSACVREGGVRSRRQTFEGVARRL